MKRLSALVICLFLVIVGYRFARADEAANLALIKKFYEAYATGDANKVAAFFSDDISWRIPGRHPLSGEKRGKAEVTAFFTELAKAGFKAEPIFFGASEHYVVDIHRGWSNVQGHPNVDTIWALVFRVEKGKIVEATNLSADQHAADNFLWSFYKLGPIPNRLR
jgi:hypothetical protein